MRESCTYGSVRGVRGNSHPYRDRRREFVTLLGSAAVCAAIPVVGFLNSWWATEWAHLVAAFNGGLNELGYAEGKSVAVEYRWAQGENDRLPGLRRRY
jgi:putative ABC transport system substrate-binding protein